jgi:hypothetical protein
MLRFLMAFMIAAVAFAVKPVLAGERSDQVKLQMLYDQAAQAISDHDVKKLLSFMDPNIEFIGTNSKRTDLEKYKFNVNKAFKNTRNNNIVFDIKDMHIDSGKATVYLHVSYHFEYYEKTAKEWIPVITKNTVDETWEKKSNAWKLVRSKTLIHKEAVDPKWLAMKKKLMYDTGKLLLPCNFSFNGCH